MRCVEPSMSVNTNVTVPDGNRVPRATMSIASHVPLPTKSTVVQDSRERLGGPLAQFVDPTDALKRIQGLFVLANVNLRSVCWNESSPQCSFITGSCGGLLGDALCAASIDTEGHHDCVDEFGEPQASIVYLRPEATT